MIFKMEKNDTKDRNDIKPITQIHYHSDDQRLICNESNKRKLWVLPNKLSITIYQWNSFNLNSREILKHHFPWPSWIHSRDKREIQHM